MKLPDVRDSYYYNSSQVSSITRQLAFAALALIWLFRPEEENLRSVPPILTSAGMAIVVCLVLDFLQYVWSTFVWLIYQSVKERQFQKQGVEDIDEIEFLAPNWINRPADFIFWVKILPLLLAYWKIGKYLLSQLA